MAETSGTSSDNSEIESKIKLNIKIKKKSFDLNICLFCQIKGTSNLISCGLKSRHKILDVIKLKFSIDTKLLDPQLFTLVKKSALIETASKILCHKSCYCTFISKHNLDFFKAKYTQEAIPTKTAE